MSENALDYQNRSFGRYLKKVREDRKLSLDAVEEMTMHYPGRVTKSHLSRIENGQAEPSFPRMCALSQIYGLPISSMAERFESDLRRASTPPALAEQPIEELVRQAKALRIAGRVDEALVLYEAAIDRREESGSYDPIALRIDRIACLAQLWRFALAKEECEALLGSASLTGEQRLRVLHSFIVCCHRTGKFTIARMCLDTVQMGLNALPQEHVLHGFFAGQRGVLHMALGEVTEAATAFHQAFECFESLGDHHEACRFRLNFADALVALGKHNEARRQVQKAIQQARGGGYDRQVAHGLQMLGKIAFDTGDLEGAEAEFLQSNAIARRAEFIPAVFANCYYLWRIARARGDDSAVRSNERTLRAYLGRVEEHMPEARQFRECLAGGGS